MSGESGRGARHILGQRVRPEPVNEKSFVENVAGFINEVVPQTYHNPSHYEGKERITWVRFEHCDINDLSQFRDRIKSNGNSPPFLLIIGYANGVQAWAIPSNGEGIEVFSWHQGPVRALKVLVSPNTSDTRLDPYSLKRPIFAICDAAGPGPHFHSVCFISLKTGEQLKTIKFKTPVQDIYANRNVVVISFPEKLAIFEATTFEEHFTISTCYPCPGPSLNPIALGDRWLAYADRRLYTSSQSCGGMVVEGAPSYKTTVLHAAKTITKGLKELGETVASNLMGQRSTTPQPVTVPTSQKTPGVVTIIDTQRVHCSEVNLSNGLTSGLVAHFLAHQGSPIVALQFDPSGLLLATADKLGHNFHIFRMQPHPMSPTQAAVHHLYILHRGDTTAKVMDISFSLDSRWIAVSTHRGTTHVYPITPYGGNIGVRTHKSVCVVNRLSRFQRSAGLDDAPSSGRNSPVLSTSPNTSKFAFEPSPNLAYPNPRYPPYPVPTVLKPLAQLRQPLLQNLFDSIVPGPSPSHSPPSSNRTPKVHGPENIVKVASIFGISRGWLAGSPTVPREAKRKAVDSLFVMAYHGNLIEYYLEPKAVPSVPQERITENSPIELEVHATAQWSLVRESTSRELRPPLARESPLMIPLFPQRGKSLSPTTSLENDDPEERWMAQVEIYTHAGPHRRLWMGPQFTFKSLPGTGNLAGGQVPLETQTHADPNLEFTQRSSPVNMPGYGGTNLAVLIEAGSLSGSHDQSPRLMERYSSESDSCDPEVVMNKLRHDIADAMMDTPQLLSHTEFGRTTKTSKSSDQTDESGFDMSDVMDISCDPPGPSSGSGRPTPIQICYKCVEEEAIQSITSKLHQVAVTSRPSAVSEAQPFWGSRTPSLEECRGLTSSAEELTSTLANASIGPEHSEFAWKPIDPPSRSRTEREDIHPVERPKPIDAREKDLVTENKVKKDSDNGKEKAKSSRKKPLLVPESNVKEPPPPVKSSWAKVAEDKENTKVQAMVKTTSDSFWMNQDQDENFPPVGLSAKQASKISKASAASGTTSEDDLWPTKEGKKDRKKRRKKNKQEIGGEVEAPTATTRDDPKNEWRWEDQEVQHLSMQGDSKEVEAPGVQECFTSIALDMDVDHFHTAEEFHEPTIDEFHDPVDDDHFLQPEIIDDFLSPTHDEDENGNGVKKEAMLLSVHDDDDLARALEEASSDESILVKTATTSGRSREANEMFPFLESSSDEEGDVRVRRRAGLVIVSHLGSNDDDDDRETSGDDRKTTSESDVTASPNPRTAAISKGKKKKKKKK